jgi:acyl carrier protein
MNIENLIQIFQSEFPDVSEKFTPTTKFRELSDWDSLTAMSILTTIEEQFGVALPENEFKAMQTIEEVYSFLSN